MKDLQLKVLRNEPLSHNTWLMELEGGPVVDLLKPGHFVMMRSWKSLDPLGRRAFAVADATESSFTIMYQVVGRATALLSQVREGEEVSVLAPLGKGLFSTEGDKHLLVGGGIGMAGLTFLGKKLIRMGKEVLVAYGARTKRELALLHWLKREGFEVLLYTEDGSEGKKGSVVDVLDYVDSTWTVHACGPVGMLRAIKNRSAGRRVFLSLEARMACGWGVCLGCVVGKEKGGYARVCYEGPVFEASEVVL
ncbi:Dihydroorotate dehydrogenase, electron transfer subunit, iron-sulphur cluster binding domain protein [Thermocrinis albus DSM 14484]|uniref:Dihydroorotate dehydrogenase, electron transfer subunit, iron-sulphur cluster binding domain protein n=1 Tax=Thermocrinis albus (strain DSM 14484 / JCM 11386 / HI 11/12) TaxID=638303 RepID=D3SQ35_THEAH|nr:dihydroorotate dehydrogenase electron transfer subunit [Thermocrinis albus]ADC89272.1 Dihydroorotate dehydrogenase, electron transfer subunit, iron-sulphur cluster binding domain protein [Thermocrinis albus DSM 14484]